MAPTSAIRNIELAVVMPMRINIPDITNKFCEMGEEDAMTCEKWEKKLAYKGMLELWEKLLGAVECGGEIIRLTESLVGLNLILIDLITEFRKHSNDFDYFRFRDENQSNRKK